MLIDRLKKIQERENLTDAAIAETLSLHPNSWNRLKNGRGGQASREFMVKTVHAFPETGTAVLEDVFGENWRELIAGLWPKIIAELKSASIQAHSNEISVPTNFAKSEWKI